MNVNMARIFLAGLLLLVTLSGACKKTGASTAPRQGDVEALATVLVALNALTPPCDAGGPLFHEYTIDLTGTVSHSQAGIDYGQFIKARVPNFEVIVDFYLFLVTQAVPYQTLLDRAAAIRNNIPAEYREEIDGMAGVLCSTPANTAGDGRLSPDELYLLQLVPDIVVDPLCSSVAVFGTTSDTGSTIVGRNLEWFGGWPREYLSLLQAVVTVKNPAPNRSVCLIGYLGFAGCITGFNSAGVFGAIHVARGNAAVEDPWDYASSGSYSLDLREALEALNSDSVDDVGALLTTKTEIAGHLIVLADPSAVKVLEYNPGPDPLYDLRVLRGYDDALNPGIDWVDTSSYQAIGAVNSFVYGGNGADATNHTGNNLTRWNTMRDQLQARLDDLDTPGTVTEDELRQVITYYGGAAPGDVDGDLFREYVQHTVIYAPGAAPATARVHFHPLCVNTPGDPAGPGFTFQTITADF